METRQRHASPAIPPWTEEWSDHRRLGFGLVSLIPLVLLMIAIAGWILGRFGVDLGDDVTPILFYTHVGAQFITLLIFGHLMVANPGLTGGMKAVWGFFFLFFAPFAIPLYWVLHVWRADQQPWSYESASPLPSHHVHVYEFDYTKREPRGNHLREDGAIIHHLDHSKA